MNSDLGEEAGAEYSEELAGEDRVVALSDVHIDKQRSAACRGREEDRGELNKADLFWRNGIAKAGLTILARDFLQFCCMVLEK